MILLSFHIYPYYLIANFQLGYIDFLFEFIRFF